MTKANVLSNATVSDPKKRVDSSERREPLTGNRVPAGIEADSAATFQGQESLGSGEADAGFNELLKKKRSDSDVEDLDEQVLSEDTTTLESDPAQTSGAGLSMDTGIQVAQLELPTIPGASSGVSSAASSVGATGAASFGGLGGVFGAVAGLGLAAGGGGGGSSAGGSGIATQTHSGRLVNGYISQAEVFLDLNGNGVLDNDKDGIDEPGEEPYDLTDAFGRFDLGRAQGTGSLIAVPTANTIDTSTNLAVTNVFKAPVGAGVISPLSTLVASGLTETELKAAFGIDNLDNLLDFDPVQAIADAASGNDLDGANLALKIKAANVNVSNIMDVGSSLLEGGGASGSNLSDLVVRSVVSSIKASSGTPIDFKSADSVSSILSSAASTAGLDVAVVSSVIASTASKLAVSSTQLEAESVVTSAADATAKLTNMAKVEKAVQSTVASLVKQAAQDPSKAASIDSLDLASEVEKAVVTEPTLEEDLLLFSGLSGAEDLQGLFDGVTPFDSKSTFNFEDAVDPNEFYDRVGSVTSGNGYDAQVGLVAFPELGSGFAEGYGAISLSIAGTGNGKIEVKLFGGQDLGDSVAVIDLKEDPSVTDLGNGWYDLVLPFAEFTNASNIAKHSGFLIAVTGESTEPFTFYFSDVELLSPASLEDLGYVEEENSGAPTGYSLIWSDEFGGHLTNFSDVTPKAIDSELWEAQVGKGPNNDGWGNGEKQSYTNTLTNAFVKNGALYITAEKEADSITSARLKSIPDVGPNSYVEVRAALPVGEGAWPAIWLLGQDAWPGTGEIDIMEWSARYFDENQVQAALHSTASHGDTQNKKSTTLGEPVTEFHTYQVWWTEDYISFGVDSTRDNAYYTFEKPANATAENWPFTDPMDLILNLAIGGTLGGTVPSTDFTYQMVVDYVRVYEAATGPSEAAPVPQVDSADVISLFSDTYENVAVSNWNPSWDQQGSLTDGQAISGNNVKKVSDLNYQGIEIAQFVDGVPAQGVLDVSAKKSLHIDFWLADTGSFKLYLISKDGGAAAKEAAFLLDGKGGWNGVDIPLDQFSGVDLNKIVQIKFEAGTASSFYFDNLYFSSVVPEGGTSPVGPISAPPTPTADAADVVSLFSDTYAAATSANWSTDWDNADVADVDLGGDAIKKYTNVGFIGIEPGVTVDASAMDTFNISVWRTDATADLKIKLVDFEGGQYNESTNVAHEINLAASGDSSVAAGRWVNLALNLSDFKGLTRTDNIAQIIISSHKYDDNGYPIASGETLYIDNLYFSSVVPEGGPSEPTAGPTAPSKNLQLVSSVTAEDDFATQFVGVADFGNGATFNFTTAADPADEYTRVLSVQSGEGYGAGVNVAFAAFTALGSGFADGYEAFDVKVFGTPSGRLEVKLIGAGENQDSVANIDLDTYPGSTAIGETGWYDVSIPFTDFTRPGNIANHSGYLIGMPGDNGITPFTFYFTDIELSLNAPGPVSAPSDPVGSQDDVISLFSDSFTDELDTTWSTEWDSVRPVEDITMPGDNVVKKYIELDHIGIEPGETLDISAMDTFHIDVWRTDAAADFKVKLVDFGANGSYDGGDDKAHEIVFNATNGNAIAANQWVSLEVPLSAFTGLTTKEHFAQLILSSTKTDEGVSAGSGESLWVDNIYFSKNLQLVSSVTAEDDFATQFVGVADFGNGATFNFTTAADPADEYTRVLSVQSGEGYGAGVNVAFAAFTALGSGFADGYEAFDVKVFGTPSGRLEVKLIGAGENQDSVANIDLDTYPGSTAIGETGWYDVSIPFTDFTRPGNIANHSGYLIGMPGDNGITPFTFYFTDIELSLNAPGPVSAPSDPVGSQDDVISLFSDSFTDELDTTWSTEWDSVRPVEDITMPGDNVVKKYIELDHIGIEPGETLDISAMDTFHIDVWRTDAAADFKVKLVDFGANGSYDGGDDKAHEIVFNATNGNAIAANQWVSLEVPLSAFTGLTTKEHFAQLILSSTKTDEGVSAGSGESLWIDNVYFSSNQVIA